MLPLLPLALVALGGFAVHKHASKPASTKIAGEGAGLSPARAKIYDYALKTVKDPQKLRNLAKVFRAEGLNAQAVMLEKRARLRELPAATKAARRDAFRKGMASTNVPGILTLADAFDREGATGAADELRKYAAGLKAA